MMFSHSQNSKTSVRGFSRNTRDSTTAWKCAKVSIWSESARSRNIWLLTGKCYIFSPVFRQGEGFAKFSAVVIFRFSEWRAEHFRNSANRAQYGALTRTLLKSWRNRGEVSERQSKVRSGVLMLPEPFDV